MPIRTDHITVGQGITLSVLHVPSKSAQPQGHVTHRQPIIQTITKEHKHRSDKWYFYVHEFQLIDFGNVYRYM